MQDSRYIRVIGDSTYVPKKNRTDEVRTKFIGERKTVKMKTRNNWTMRAAGMMLALVLITSSFVGGTFAKYTTSGNGEDSARVAKFGVNVEVSANNVMFKKEYETDNIDAKNASISLSVKHEKSTSPEFLVAPGTKVDDAVKLSITGKPEVAVNVKIEVDPALDVYLLAGTYNDPTKASGTFKLDKDYHPVKFTLKREGTVLKDGVPLTEIKNYLENTLSKNYGPNENLGSYLENLTLSWEWPYEGEGVNDAADTLLGNLTAGVGVGSVPIGKYWNTIQFKLTATVTQID